MSKKIIALLTVIAILTLFVGCSSPDEQQEIAQMNAIEDELRETLEQAQALYLEQDFRGALELARAANAASNEEVNEDLAAQASDLVAQIRVAWLEKLDSKVEFRIDEFTGQVRANPNVHETTFEQTSDNTGFEFTFSFISPREEAAHILFFCAFVESRANMPRHVIFSDGNQTLEVEFLQQSARANILSSRLFMNSAGVNLEADEINILSEMVLSDNDIRVRFQGQNGRTDVTMTTEQREHLSIAIDYYFANLD